MWNESSTQKIHEIVLLAYSTSSKLYWPSLYSVSLVAFHRNYVFENVRHKYKQIRHIISWQFVYIFQLEVDILIDQLSFDNLRVLKKTLD